MAKPFPTKLPYPIRDGFSRSYSRNIARVGMDDGQFRRRRKWDSQPQSYALAWSLTWDELALFEAFVEYDTNGASDWFTIVVIKGTPAITMRFVSKHKASFNSATGNWQVQAECEMLMAAPVVPSAPATLPEWPATLPIPEKEGYAYAQVEALARSNIESGKAAQRVRFKDRVTTFSAKWIFTADQLAQFDAFVRNTLIDANAPFMAPFANGEGETLVKANFKSPPKVTSLGAIYTVLAELETTSAPMMSVLDYLTDGTGTIKLAETIRWVDNVVTSYQGRIAINEYVYWVARSSRAMRLTELVNWAAIISVRAKKRFEEVLIYLDQIAKGITTGTDEQFGFLDQVKAVLKKGLVDIIKFQDQVLASAKFRLQTSEQIGFSTSGKVTVQDYVDQSYFAQDYTLTIHTF